MHEPGDARPDRDGAQPTGRFRSIFWIDAESDTEILAS